MQLTELRNDLSQLRSSVGQRRKELNAFMEENEANLSDPYVHVMLPFLKSADEQVRRQVDQLDQAERMYIEALKFYGENSGPKLLASQVSPSEDFFGIFREFTTAYVKCQKDNAARAEALRAEQKRQEAEEQRSRHIAMVKSQEGDAFASQHLLDDVLQSLQESSVASRRERRETRQSRILSGLSDTPRGVGGDPMDMAAQLLAELNPDLAASTTSHRTHRRARDSTHGSRSPASLPEPPIGRRKEEDEPRLANE